MPVVPQSENALEAVEGTREEKLRRLAHDLSNSLEIIMQCSFLLGTLDLGENGKAWHKLLEEGISKITAQNQQLRETLRKAE